MITALEDPKVSPVPWAEPRFTFAETVKATGVGDLWLRSLLQRDKESAIGTRHKLGRLLFSLNDIFQISAINGLNAFVGLPPQAAREVAKAALALLPSRNFPLGSLHFAFDGQGRAMVWTEEDGVLVSWSDAGDDDLGALHAASRRPHIIIPFHWMWDAVGRAVRMTSEDAK